MNWIALLALSSCLTAGGSVLDKYLMRGGSAPPAICAATFGLVSLPVVLVGFFLVPPLPFAPAVAAWLAGLLYTLAVWLYYRIVIREAISIVVPLLRLTAVQTLLGGVLILHERLSPTQLGAFAILFFSSALLTITRTVSGKVRPGAAILHILPVTTLLAASNVFLAQAYHIATLWQGQVYQAAGMASSLPFLALVIFWSLRRAHTDTPCKPTPMRTWIVLLLEQSTRMVTQVAPAIALAQQVPVALVSAAGVFQPLWVWVLALLLLGERQGRVVTAIRAAGLCGTLVGAFLLR